MPSLASFEISVLSLFGINLESRNFNPNQATALANLKSLEAFSNRLVCFQPYVPFQYFCLLSVFCNGILPLPIHSENCLKRCFSCISNHFHTNKKRFLHRLGSLHTRL